MPDQREGKIGRAKEEGRGERKANIQVEKGSVAPGKYRLMYGLCSYFTNTLFVCIHYTYIHTLCSCVRPC